MVSFVPGMAEAVTDRAALAEDLTAAMAAGDQLAVHYQPVVTLPGGQASGYEALLRWRHPTRGPIPPLQFIPIAEQTGAITALGTWVLRQATRDAVTGLGGECGPSKVAVNVSAVQLADQDFVGTVRAALADSGLPAERLVLEVTESVLADDLVAVCARLQQLRDLGVRIAIDDFGTGYSSLSYLRQLPADIVKVDRSFITDLARGGAATTLVASIVELARSLSLDVVAEGVETELQRDTLAALGCTYAQGYLFGRPEPVAPAPAQLPLTT
ncbi:putative bifunctional diguanylate cyclase/phosphodiesterase [Klenkia terrae]|uniref:putative bifunctional diguanylate cyclase/phosphodiesterase n=1 Tax=Klenkia terrae TaxID=1052259 RepID=UPI0036229603